MTYQDYAHLTDSQRATLDRVYRDGWRFFHQSSDGEVLIAKQSYRSGSSGIGVNLPGPFWTHVGRTRGDVDTDVWTILPDGTIPEEIKQERAFRTKMMLAGMFFAPILFFASIGVGPIAFLTVPISLLWIFWAVAVELPERFRR